VKAKADAEPPDTERGRRQTIAILVTLVGSIVIVALLGGSTLPAMLIQLIVIGLLGLQLFRGAAWARWVLVAIAALTVVGNGWAAAQGAQAGGASWAINAALAAIYAWCGFFLAVSRSLAAFVTAQREKVKSQT